MNVNNQKKGLHLTATHPGELLRDELEYRGVSLTELAQGMKVDIALLQAITAGERSITADMAMLIEKTLGIDAYYWTRMQAKYDVDTLRIKEWESNGDVASASILKEPKSAYFSLAKRAKSAE